MEREQKEIKAKILIFVVWMLALIFIARLFGLQVIEGDYYKTLSENNFTRNIVIRSARGILKDRKGIVLCTNRLSYDLYIDPFRVKDTYSLIKHLKAIPDVSFTDNEIKKFTMKSNFNQRILAKKDITIDAVTYVESRRIWFPELSIESNFDRFYPFGQIAAHVIGYVGEVSSEEMKFYNLPDEENGSLFGKMGAERSLNPFLMGKSGIRVAQVNSLGREIENPIWELPLGGIKKKAEAGMTITTTLDIGLQKVVEDAFGEETGSAVFVNPNTGEILALVSRPAFDPNWFGRKLNIVIWKHLVEDPGHPLLNRSISSAYSPGSTFKVLISAAALEEGTLKEDTVLTCSGILPFGNTVFHCWKKGGHGGVSILRAIQNSCNIFFYKTGNMLGIDKIDKWGSAFGFGQKTNIELRGEQPGLLPTPAWKKEKTGEQWYQGETLPVAIGQGYLNVTPVQMVRFISAIGNGGRLIAPHLIHKKDYPYKTIPLHPETLNIIKEGLWRVVNGGGTGGRARIAGLDVCAKTGTAQVVAKSTGVKSSSLPKDIRDHAWFIGFAPKDNPKVAFAIMVEHGGHGGDIAAPIAKKALIYLFGEGTQKKSPSRLVAKK